MIDSASQALGLQSSDSGSAGDTGMTVAQVWAERARMLSDPEWRAAWENGDPAKRVEMNQVMSSAVRWGIGDNVNINDFPAGIASQLHEQRAKQVAIVREDQIDGLRTRAIISDEVAQQHREGTPVTAAEKRQAEDRRNLLFADKAWRDRFYAGDVTAKTELALLQIIRSAPLKAA